MGAVIGFPSARRLRAAGGGRRGLALVDLTAVEQRYRAVLAVQAGRPVTEVAPRSGCPGRPCTRGCATADARPRGRSDARRPGGGPRGDALEGASTWSRAASMALGRATGP